MKRFIALAVVLLVTAPRAQAQDGAYREIVESLASPAYFEFEESKNGHSDTMVMLRLEQARQRLNGVRNWPAALAPYRLSLIDKLESCRRSLAELRRLDQRMPDFEGIVSRGLEAGPGLIKVVKSRDLNGLNQDEQMAVAKFAVRVGAEVIGSVVNAYNASAERNSYQRSYDRIRRDAVAAVNKACPDQYAGVERAKGKALEVGVSGSWCNTFINDLLYLRNDTGKDLTNCTLLVTLNGFHAKSDQREYDNHVHYVAHWPAGKWLYLTYPSRAKSGIATNESVDIIESVAVSLYSKQCWDKIDYTHAGMNHDDDVKRNVEADLPGEKFSGSWYHYDNHTFFNNGFKFQYNGRLSYFPVWSVTVKAKRGNVERAVRFSINARRMAKGEGMWLSHAGFNVFNGRPETVEVEFEFPRSAHRHSVFWRYQN
jgi:hypothetical protein